MNKLITNSNCLYHFTQTVKMWPLLLSLWTKSLSACDNGIRMKMLNYLRNTKRIMKNFQHYFLWCCYHAIELFLAFASNCRSSASESYWTVLSWSAVYLTLVQGGSSFWVFGWNSKVWLSKLYNCCLFISWNILGSRHWKGCNTVSHPDNQTSVQEMLSLLREQCRSKIYLENATGYNNSSIPEFYWTENILSFLT